jgi:hypothetical protein
MIKQDIRRLFVDSKIKVNMMTGNLDPVGRVGAISVSRLAGVSPEASSLCLRLGN